MKALLALIDFLMGAASRLDAWRARRRDDARQREHAEFGPDCEHMLAQGARGPCYPCWRRRELEKVESGRSPASSRAPKPAPPAGKEPPKAA